MSCGCLHSAGKKKLTGQAAVPSPRRASITAPPSAAKPSGGHSTNARASPLQASASPSPPSHMLGGTQVLPRGSAHKVHHTSSPGLKAIQPRSPQGAKPSAAAQRGTVSSSVVMPPWMQSRSGASGSHISSNRSNLSGGAGHGYGYGQAGGQHTAGAASQNGSGGHGSGSSSLPGSRQTSCGAMALPAARPMGRPAALQAPKSPGALAARPRTTPPRQPRGGHKQSPQGALRGSVHVPARGGGPARRMDTHETSGYDSDGSVVGSPSPGSLAARAQNGGHSQSVGRRAAAAVKGSLLSLGCVSPAQPGDEDADVAAGMHGHVDLSPTPHGHDTASPYGVPQQHGYSVDPRQAPCGMQHAWMGHGGAPGGRGDDMFEEVAISGAYRLKDAASPPTTAQRMGAAQYGHAYRAPSQALTQRLPQGPHAYPDAAPGRMQHQGVGPAAASATAAQPYPPRAQAQAQQGASAVPGSGGGVRLGALPACVGGGAADAGGGAEDAISAQLRDLVLELQSETSVAAEAKAKHEMRYGPMRACMLACASMRACMRTCTIPCPRNAKPCASSS